MQRHRFDPLSLALAVTAIGVGIMVAVGRASSFADDAGWWLALLALLLGLALVPWNGVGRGGDDRALVPANHRDTVVAGNMGAENADPAAPVPTLPAPPLD